MLIGIMGELGVLWFILDLLEVYYVESALSYIAFESILVNNRSTMGYVGRVWEYFRVYWEYTGICWKWFGIYFGEYKEYFCVFWEFFGVY